MATRINKYLSEVGFCSRRAADILIEERKVTINGEIIEIGSKVEEGDQVEVEGQKIINSIKQKNIYLAFNKPIGIVCTTDRGVEPDNIIDFIKYPKRIFPIGRLDKPSEGLIFGELLLVLITIVFIYLKPISRIYVADYLEKISLFLFRTVSDEELNEWYEKREKYKYKLLEESGGSSY